MSRLIFSLALLFPSSVIACSCATSDLGDLYRGADLVFVATAIRGRDNCDLEVERGVSCIGGPRLSVVESHTVYKDPYDLLQARNRVYIMQDGGNCNVRLTPEREYLIFARHLTGRTYTTNSCSGTAPLNEKRELLEKLGNIKEAYDDLESP